MVKLAVAVVVFSWALLCCLDCSAAVDPLCEGKKFTGLADLFCKVCADSEVCRAVETCTSSAICSLEARCIDFLAENCAKNPNVTAGGCANNYDNALLEESAGGYKLRVCHRGRDCPDDFYCSTLLQDVSSRCCRAAPPERKSGICPYPQDFPDSEYFCYDECRSDADCHSENKCCQISATCEKRDCQPPVFV